MSVNQPKSEIEQMFESFKETSFYLWLDNVIAGRWRWVILPMTGLVDAFVIVIPTELVVAMYMMRNRAAVWWQHTIVVSLFSAFGYGILSIIAAKFGIDAVSWLAFFTGEEIATVVDKTISNNILLLAISSGLTSFFPMPATLFSITIGLMHLSIIPLMIGTFLGKFIRFGMFAYGARRWGGDVLQYYFRHANTISLVLIVLLVLYLILQ